MKTYFVILRYMLASFITALVDYAVFSLSYTFSGNILLSTYLGRLASIFVNYAMVRQLVFHSEVRVISTFPKYVSLVAFSGFLSWLLIKGLEPLLGISVFFAKILAEGILYFMNFAVQRLLIFRK